MKIHGFMTMSVLARCLIRLSVVFSTANAKETPGRDWHVRLSLEYSRRTLDGSIIRQTTITDNLFGGLMATGDSMNLGESDTFILGLDFELLILRDGDRTRMDLALELARWIVDVGLHFLSFSVK